MLVHEREVVGHARLLRLAEGRARLLGELGKALHERPELHGPGHALLLRPGFETERQVFGPRPAKMPATREIEVAPRQRIPVEAVLDDQLDPDAQDGLGRQAPVLVHDEGRLEIVVEGDRALPVDTEMVGRGLALEVDENPFDGVHALHLACCLQDRLHDVGIDAPALADGGEEVLARHGRRGCQRTGSRRTRRPLRRPRTASRGGHPSLRGSRA